MWKSTSRFVFGRRAKFYFKRMEYRDNFNKPIMVHYIFGLRSLMNIIWTKRFIDNEH